MNRSQMKFGILTCMLLLAGQYALHASDSTQTFMLGVNLESIWHHEQQGKGYFENGLPKSALQSLKEQGANTVRIIVKMPPFPSPGGNPLDWGSQVKAIQKMQEAKILGLTTILSLTFTDLIHADSFPNDNVIPTMWKPDQFDSLVLGNLVETYVKDFLQKLKDSSLVPDIVVIGNETSSEFLHPDIPQPYQSYERTAYLLSRGIDAAKDFFTLNTWPTKIAIHLLSVNGMGWMVKWWLEHFTQLGISNQYDYLSISFSPHQAETTPFADWTQLVNFVKGYGKEFFVMEINTDWTSGGYDATPEAFNTIPGHADAHHVDNFFVPSADAQKNYLIKTAHLLKDAGAIGMIYWGGGWVGSDQYFIPTSSPGSTWEIRTLWDSQYEVHRGLSHYRLFETRDNYQATDIDGDGLTNDLEMVLGREPFYEGDFGDEFDTLLTYGNWSFGGGGTYQWNGGELVANPASSSYMIYDDLSMDVHAVRHLLIKEHTALMQPISVIWFATDGSQGFITSKVYAAKGATIHHFDLLAHPQLAHKVISSFMFLLSYAGGQEIRWDWMRAATKDTDGDGLEDLLEEYVYKRSADDPNDFGFYFPSQVPVQDRIVVVHAKSYSLDSQGFAVKGGPLPTKIEIQGLELLGKAIPKIMVKFQGAHPGNPSLSYSGPMRDTIVLAPSELWPDGKGNWYVLFDLQHPQWLNGKNHRLILTLDDQEDQLTSIAYIAHRPDTDQDGMTDDRELKLNRDPEEVIDFGFDFDLYGDIMGWEPDNMNGYYVGTTVLDLTLKPGLFSLSKSGLSIPLAPINAFHIKHMGMIDELRLTFADDSSASIQGDSIGQEGGYQISRFEVGSFQAKKLVGLAVLATSTSSQSLSIDWIKHSSTRIKVKAYLEGPWDQSTMKNDLKPNLPLAQPYHLGPWDYAGMESVESHRDEVVDWVLVSLRDPSDPETVLAERAALLHRDGNIWGTSEIQGLVFPDLGVDTAYVVLHHRNHLPLMSASPIALGSLFYQTLDFSDPVTSVYGDHARKIIQGRAMMWAGDANGDGVINAIDLNGDWRVFNGQIVPYEHMRADFNLDGIINLMDKEAFWRINNSRASSVPK
ncbi:MAG: glycosyl hydrolase 53 family protein [Bacteroidota bacterium]